MEKKQKQKKENSERWLLTYSDLITLLMILFILLFAMGNVDKEKYKDLAASLNNSLGNGASNSVINGATGVLPTKGNASHKSSQKAASSTPTPKITTAPDSSGNTKLSGYLSTKQDMKRLQSYFNKILSGLKMKDYVTTDVRSDGLVTTFSNDVVFDSGTDTLKAEMISGLKKLSPLLSSIDNTILVEGYTDNIPITSSSKFSSNWQLSSARAANVVQFLVDQCGVNGNHISAVGYGQYHPTASNDTVQGRSKNRRIEIIILYK